MNRALSLTMVLLCLTLGALAAQSTGGTLDTNLGWLSDDLGTLFSTIGTDIAPQLLQTSLSSDLVGEAAFKGDFPHGSVTFPSIGVGLGNGIATVLNDPDRVWNFASPLPSIVQTAFGSSGSGQDLYQATRQIFPYPTTSFGIGFGITKGVEVLVNGIYWPQSLTGAIVGLLPSKVASLDPAFSATSVLVKVRKVFLRDSGPYPALSLALGGVYSNANLSATIDLTKLSGSPMDISGLGTLNLVGPLSMDTSVFGTGLEFAISKRLPVITPFANVGLWYRRAVVSTSTDLTASIQPTADTDPNHAVKKEIVAGSTSVDDGIDARIGAGLEIRIWAMILHLSANLDLEDPLVQIDSFSLTGIAANGLSLSTGIRWSF